MDTNKYNNTPDRKAEAFARLLAILDELRVKCPWDREQTAESLRNCTIEETFELADAIAEGDWDAMRQELGDLLLHVVFYAKIADEEKRFDIAGVIDSLCEKLVFRHPHVFGDVEADDAARVKQNWEQLKLKEKNRKQRGVLGGVPRSLPAMVKAFRIGEKASAAGFDWEAREDVWHKVREEIGEVEHEIAAGDREKLEGEVGDLLFSLVNVARLYGVDPEIALERSNKKFINRFNYIESRAGDAGKALKELGTEQMEAWWNEAKTDKGS